MHETVSRIVIVGGGTAGWITACRIAAQQPRMAERGIEITLIESPDIPTIGVGEGTWPSMRMTLQAIGISEADLVRECGASFKQGTQFVGWSEAGDEHRYIHPFSLPAEYSSLNLASYWLASGSEDPFADFVTPQARVIAAALAPKQTTTPEYAFNVNYGYHFDAGRFAGLLHRHAVEKLGVRYVPANVVGVESADNGDIAALQLSGGSRERGDLFVDCTGPRAILIGRHYGIDLVSVKGIICNDAAIAVQVPNRSADAPIASTTVATAVESGWIWDIGLQNRRGIGHVYSRAHADEDTAMAAIRNYIGRAVPGTKPDDLSFRSIRFEPGFRRRFWVNNCVAVGLSGGFIEPLEASALALIEQSATIVAGQLPADRELMDVVARRYNDKLHYHWERVVEFLKLHYVLSRRDDSDYWRDCRRPESCPESLREKLVLWQQQPPWHDDAPRVDELFPSASYQYVLYGMGFRPRYGGSWSAELERDRPRVDAVLHANEETARRMLSLLPSNRDLVDAMTALAGVA